ncbi:segregation and condensation protein B [Kineococcus xinjiangensis]|uniref:Segregation and condensation protein B n=1 Tax=Kineococcus xinjiangensis TaxID=512762 RepID=A0A2S6ICB1_9ACTN|nr:SMC-Scp complex subunit ScpB [Kineococcus xinjiangensis]PPK90854.1 segregation and condensation protein B [Kineococcus xinjiangensis]
MSEAGSALEDGYGPGEPVQDEPGLDDGERARLRPALEAVLMVADDPVGVTALARATDSDEATITAVLRDLAGEYSDEGRGFELREVAGGWRMFSRPEHAGVVEAFLLDGQTAKLTQAALETLAIVAYRQPVSRARVSAVRGVSVDGVMRTLLSRGLVAEAGVEATSGATLYRTTDEFLHRMGLTSLEDLPPLAPFLPELTEVDAVLQELEEPEVLAPQPREPHHDEQHHDEQHHDEQHHDEQHHDEQHHDEQHHDEPDPAEHEPDQHHPDEQQTAGRESGSADEEDR